MNIIELISKLMAVILGKKSVPKISVTSGGDSNISSDVVIGVKKIETINLISGDPAKLEEIDNKLDKLLKAVGTEAKQPPPKPESNSPENKTVIELIHTIPTKETKAKLKSIFYSSTDNIARLNASLGLANWFNAREDSIDEFIGMYDEGTRICDTLGIKREKAVLLSYKATLLYFQFIWEDTETYYIIQMANVSGVPIITEEQRQAAIGRMSRLEEGARKCLVEAERLANDARSLDALAIIYSGVGSISGQLSHHFTQFGIRERAQRERLLSMKAYETAKRIYEAIGDMKNVGYVLHNLANTKRAFGELHDARVLVQQAIKIGREYNEETLLWKAEELLKFIDSELRSRSAPSH